MSEEVEPLAELIQLPLGKWKLYQCIILDWYDMPLEGFCELEIPAINFYFKAFAISELNSKVSLIYKAYITSDKLLLADFKEKIKDVSEEKFPFWNPLLIHDSSYASFIRNEIDVLVNLYKSESQFLIHSEGMKKFLGIWNVLL